MTSTPMSTYSCRICSPREPERTDQSDRRNRSAATLLVWVPLPPRWPWRPYGMLSSFVRLSPSARSQNASSRPSRAFPEPLSGPGCRACRFTITPFKASSHSGCGRRLAAGLHRPRSHRLASRSVAFGMLVASGKRVSIGDRRPGRFRSFNSFNSFRKLSTT